MSINAVAYKVLQMCEANSETLSAELAERSDRSEFYQYVAAIIANAAPSLSERLQREITVISERSEGLMPINEQWVLRNKSNRQVRGEAFLENLKAAREQMVEAKSLTPELQAAISSLSISALSPEKLSQLDPLDIAYWINLNRVPLAEAKLSMEKLKLVAPHLRYVDCRGLYYNLNASDYANAEELYLSSDEIKNLSGLPPHLKILDCTLCRNLKSIDLSNALNLRKVNFSECYALGGLNVSKQTLLVEIKFSRTQITSLDVTKNRDLQVLICPNNKISSLNLKINTELVELDCSFCPIAWPWLELYTNQKLQKLYFHGTSIRYHNLTMHPKLIEFGCNGSEMNGVNFFKCPDIKKVYVNGCPLDRIVLIHNPLLIELEACQTLLTLLDLSTNPLLQKVRASDNKNLEHIYGGPLEHCRLLIADNCPLLRNIPSTPKSARFSSRGSYYFYTSIKEIEKDPRKVMIDFGDCVFQRSHPLVVLREQNCLCLLDKKQFRQFFRMLFDHLFKDFQFEVRHENGCAKISDIHALRSFARLVCFAASYPVAMGPHLDHLFMRTLLTANPKEIDLSKEEDPIFRVLEDPDEKNKEEEPIVIKFLQNLFSINRDEGSRADLYPLEFKDLISTLSPERQLAIKIMAKEFIEEKGKHLKVWEVKKAQEFINSVEGVKISQERLLESIRVYDSENAERIKGFFKRFLEEHPEKLKPMSKRFPGTFQLHGEPINVMLLKWREQNLPPVILPSQEIEMPPYTSYEVFEGHFLKLF